jgi:hypothetical protein
MNLKLSLIFLVAIAASAFSNKLNAQSMPFARLEFKLLVMLSTKVFPLKQYIRYS